MVRCDVEGCDRSFKKEFALKIHKTRKHGQKKVVANKRKYIRAVKPVTTIPTLAEAITALELEISVRLGVIDVLKGMMR